MVIVLMMEVTKVLFCQSSAWFIPLQIICVQENVASLQRHSLQRKNKRQKKTSHIDCDQPFSSRNTSVFLRHKVEKIGW